MSTTPTVGLSVVAPTPKPPAIRQWKQASTLGLYGETGSGKTHQVVLLIRYLLKRWGWTKGDPPLIRMGSWDSTSDPYLEYIESGAIDFIPFLAVTEGNQELVVIQLLQAVGRGHWRMPIGIDDAHGNPIYCWRGGEEVASEKLRKLHPTIPPGHRIPSALPQHNGIRAYILEGISEMADLLLREHAQKSRGVEASKAANLKYAMETLLPSEMIVGLSEQVISGSPTQSHYQDVKTGVLLTFLKTGVCALPIDLVVLTMHQAKGRDEVDTGTAVLGPDMPGQKAIGQVIQKFSHFLHLQSTVVRDKPVERKAYYEPHYGAIGTTLSQMQWPAKLSLGPSLVEEFRKKYPSGIPLDLNPQTPTNSVADVLEFVWRGSKSF